jgi:hypothetical protein
VAGFAAVSAAVIGAAALGLGAVFDDGAGHRAVAVSAGVAFAVQVAAFAVVHRLRGRNVMAAWGLGMALRFIVLGVYGLAVVRALGLAPTAALLSLGTFFFVSILVEPWFFRA